METRLSKKRQFESQKQGISFSTSLFDLPMEMLIYLGQFLELEHILKFRCYSRYSREVGDAMLSDRRELTITQKCPRNEMQLRVILQLCHSLRKISITLDDEDDDKVLLTDEIIENLLSNNPLLEEIELRSLSWLRSETLAPLVTKCEKLVKLTVHGGFCDKFLETINAHNNHLLEVDFDVYIEDYQFEIIWEFFKNQPKLQRISLPCMAMNHDSILFTIAELCKDLTYFGNFRGTIHALRKIVDNCPKLKTIEFSNNVIISDEMLSCLRAKNIEKKVCFRDREILSELEDDDILKWANF